MTNTLDYFIEHENPQIPFSMRLGSNPEKHLVVVGGLHGNEPLGIKAAVEYHNILKRIQLDGIVTFILGNPEAHRKYINGDSGARFVDTDLNRAFRDDLDESHHEYSRVQEFRFFFEQNKRIDTKGTTVILDLHSVSSGDFKICVYPHGSEQGSSLAFNVCTPSIHFIYRHDHVEGAMLSEALKYGFRPIAIECGNHKADDGLDIAMDHITRMLAHIGIVNPVLLPQTQTELPSQVDRYTSIAKIIYGLGFRWANPEIGTRGLTELELVRKGQEYAADDEGPRIAPADCYIIMPTKDPKPNHHDLGFLCTKEAVARQDS